MSRTSAGALIALMTLMAVLASGARTVLAQVTPTGSETPVNTTLTGQHRQPDVAMAADGSYIVVWDGQGPGDSWGIFAQRYGANGVSIGGETPINTPTLDPESRPSVAMASDGRFIVAWGSPTIGADSDGGVAARRFAADGTPQGSDFLVNVTTTGSQRSVSVAMAADGSSVVAWTDTAQDKAMARFFAPDGQPQTGELIIGANLNELPQAAAMTPDGRAIVAWSRFDLEIGAQRFAAGGTPAGGPFRVNTVTDGLQLRPSVAATADGRCVVAWMSANGDFSVPRVDGQRFAADGTPDGEPFQINVLTTPDLLSPVVAVCDDGRFVVAWDTDDQNGLGVAARRYASDGTPASSEFRVNTTVLGTQDASSVAAAADGRFVVAWESYPDDLSSFTIEAQRYLVNQPPVVGLAAGQLAYSEGSGPVVVDGGATVQDADSPNLQGGILTATLPNSQPGDRLAIRNQGTGGGQIGVSGTNVTFGGTTIGTIGGGATALTVPVTLNNAATPADVQALLRNVTYETTSENPSTAVRVLTATVSDGDGDISVRASRGIAVTPVNDAPVAASDSYTLSSASITVAAPGVLANDTDVDSPTLTAQLAQAPGGGTVQLQPDGSFTYTAGPRFTGRDTFSYRASDGALPSAVTAVSISGTASPCLPRPKVTPTASGDGVRLLVHVEATPLNNRVNNPLQQLQFGQLQNARVTVLGRTVASGEQVTVPSGSFAVDFVVERATAGQPTTVPFTVVDGCGSWQTFVGGGSAAGF